MTEAKITHDYVVKDLDDMEEMCKVEAISNKVLEAIINRLVEEQTKENEGLRSELKKIKHRQNIKKHHLRKSVKLAETSLK